jgi:hypothetical protein
MSYTTYKYNNQSFLESHIKNDTPIYHNQWRNDPLNSKSIIDPRRCGYKPYHEYQVVTEQKPFNIKDAVFQGSCDLTLPVSKYYLKTGEIITQP